MGYTVMTPVKGAKNPRKKFFRKRENAEKYAKRTDYGVILNHANLSTIRLGKKWKR